MTPNGDGRAPHVGVVGATGAAGGTVLRILEERRFRLAELRCLASARSAGTTLRFAGRDHVVAEVSDESLDGLDVVFFAAGSSTARRYAPVVAKRGGVAIPLTVALAPLHRAFGLQRLTVATYQAASGGGRDLVAELREQEQADAAGQAPAHRVYPHVLHGNVVPGGWTMHGDDTDEELKVIAETRRVLGIAELPVSVTTVRVPVATGHSAAVWAEFDGPVRPEAARELLAAAAGVRVVDDPAGQRYPTPRDATGQDQVLVGRIRADIGRPGAIALFLSVDNLRKGAATNAVQVGELLAAR